MSDSEKQQSEAYYHWRQEQPGYAYRYASLNPAHLFTIHSRQRAVIGLLKRLPGPFNQKRILEIGCGSGGVMQEYLTYSSNPGMISGIDLQIERVRRGRELAPHLGFAIADGQALPFPANSFDLALQYTTFSMMLNPQARQQAAAEVLRVLKPDGALIWYDFWLNPANPSTTGIRRREIKALFPGCEITFRRITLSPPLTRQLIKVSWLACDILERLKIFNTHYLALIKNTQLA